MRRRIGRRRAASTGLLALSALALSSGCLGYFHSMHHRHRAARAIFWTEVAALGLVFACDDGGSEDLFSSDSAAFYTLVLGCEIFDAYGLLLTKPVEKCDECAVRAVVTPAGVALTFRF